MKDCARADLLRHAVGHLEARPACARRRALPSIAVLPFLNLSSDKENEYFSDGLAEEIINALTRIENLRVTARTSAFVFRGAQQDVRQIGETLQVAERARRQRSQGRQPRAHQRAADRCSGRQQSLVGALRPRDDRRIRNSGRDFAGDRGEAEGTPAVNRVQATNREPLVKRYTENLEAYDLYLKGRFELYKMTREGLDASQALFEEAIRLDPQLRAGA